MARLLQNQRLVFLLLVLSFFVSNCADTRPRTSNEKNIHHKKNVHFKEAEPKMGIASWYGRKFHGRKTANGERFNTYSYTAAHKTLPFGTLVRLTHPSTGKTATVRINDRGPFIRGREFDVSFKAAKDLGIVAPGHALLQYEILSPSLQTEKDHGHDKSKSKSKNFSVNHQASTDGLSTSKGDKVVLTAKKR